MTSLPIFFFFSCCKKLYCFHSVHGLGESWLKSCLVAAGRGSGRSPDTRGMQRGSSKAAGLWGLLAVLGVESF